MNSLRWPFWIFLAVFVGCGVMSVDLVAGVKIPSYSSRFRECKVVATRDNRTGVKCPGWPHVEPAATIPFVGRENVSIGEYVECKWVEQESPFFGIGIEVVQESRSCQS